ncbi:Bardet-Biedl syndrome 10 protein [Lampris incognitus]|uniref:Bardet-Biedl syndrome 10 protein n=1 Tax=Lampris incognitus TaxID=2546036 RepID=UPI0024B56FF5|nr:Bardet-Biedl syndrome 10 protein [Lampris incognitus]
MLQVEHLQLKRVLQAVSALEAVVLRSFGPDGGQVLFTRDTGQVMLSRNGTRTLTALRLEHPIARMAVECVWKHSAVTGDGSKTFIILLASLLRRICAVACKDPEASRIYISREAGQAAAARRLTEELLAFGSEELVDVIAAGVVPYGGTLLRVGGKYTDTTNTKTLQRLLASFFLTRLGHNHWDFISRLTCEFLSHWRCHDDWLSLRVILDNFAALHTPVSGFPVSCSRLIEGQVIHRDFSTPHPQTDQQPIKAVVVSRDLQPNVLSGEVLELGGGKGETGGKEESILRYCAWAERSLESVIETLQDVGIVLVLSTVKQSAASLALARQAGMCVVECVSEDELSLFAQLSGVRPVSDFRLIGPEHVAMLTCRPILLGAHRYVHVAFPESEGRIQVKPYSLVICGPGEGQTDQCACALQDAIRMLFSTWEPQRATGTGLLERASHSHKSKPSHWEDYKHKTTHTFTNDPPSQKCVLEPGSVIPVGGTFEFLLHHALLQHGYSCSVSDSHTLSRMEVGLPAKHLLADALLSVPKQIYSSSPRRFLQAQTQVMRYMQSYSGPLGCEDEHNRGFVKCRGHVEGGGLSQACSRKVDTGLQVSVFDSGIESVSCKYQLILDVLQCLRSLLRADTLLWTHTLVHPQSHRKADTSPVDTDEEDDH